MTYHKHHNKVNIVEYLTDQTVYNININQQVKAEINTKIPR